MGLRVGPSGVCSRARPDSVDRGGRPGLAEGSTAEYAAYVTCRVAIGMRRTNTMRPRCMLMVVILAGGDSVSANVPSFNAVSRTGGRNVVGVHNCGWAPNWHAEGGHQHYRWHMLSEVSASGYVALLPNGSAPFAICGKPAGFQQTEYTEMRALAQQNGVRWTFNVSPAKDFSTMETMDAFLNDTVARAAAVASLAAVLHAEEADGLMLDF